MPHRFRKVASPYRLPRPTAFLLVSITLAMFFVTAGAPTPLLPIYEAQWHFATWLLTLAFGIYAIGMLGALLVVGSLSDHIGRRPVLIGSLALELVATIVFLTAPSIAWIVTARGLQGIATGAATSAFSAAIIDLAPEARKSFAAVITSMAPVGGLAAGALLAGFTAQFVEHAAALIWTVLILVMALGTVLSFFIPETVVRKPGAIASLTPKIAVPETARRHFTVAIFALTGAWMTAALFIGLMPTILGAVFHHQGAFESGATSFIEPAIATITTLLAGRVRPNYLVIPAGISVVLGAGLVVAGIATAMLPVLWIGGVIGGFGFGATLSATIRSLTPQAELHERAELFAAIYVVAYLAFGVPAIVAGLFVTSLGITTIAIVFGSIIAITAGIGVAGNLHLRHAEGSRTAAR
ncbi:MFS transporter [Bifidobacterium psychraerophilum]|jgi:MFS family permease|uniref:MFS transporter n=1 Tax=Bifidobacterium psychraerophilum TaxID=218140 RepID=UPI0023F02792|nr:MFS transporter [Bifidobacterium psychraerophilum]MCI1660322.1 MFS transporter [Bifidobacterium psychraerophilum]MCI1805053.1 MFS transporter [Bifidobacterium psychraerophilum]MCI2175610.1 MFS transporter [Bifidobacterium psychraerophilum]MCI2182104.1 MFS transporter [Bifidobacterium psychraerophilum]